MKSRLKILTLFLVVLIVVCHNKKSEAKSNYTSYSVESYIGNDYEDDVIFEINEEMPTFPGGQKALYQFIADNIIYPQKAKEDGVEGTVNVRAVLTKEGLVENVEVMRGLTPELNEEAVRVIKLLPKFTPAKFNGKPVNMLLILPVKFKLNKEDK